MEISRSTVRARDMRAGHTPSFWKVLPLAIVVYALDFIIPALVLVGTVYAIWSIVQ